MSTYLTISIGPNRDVYTETYTDTCILKNEQK